MLHFEEQEATEEPPPYEAVQMGIRKNISQIFFLVDFFSCAPGFSSFICEQVSDINKQREKKKLFWK